jgi:hypothetical protein
LKVRKCLALKSAKWIYPSNLNTSYIRPDRINFSCPRVNTRPTRAGGVNYSLNDILEELSPDLHEHSTLIDNCRVTHVTAIQETACKETK